MNDIRLTFKSIQRLADILPMQRAHRRIRNIIKYGGGKDTLIAGEIDRLQECRTIDIVGRAPGAVYPVSTSLQDIMLEIVLVF